MSSGLPDLGTRAVPLLVALAAFGVIFAALELAWPGFFLHDDNASFFAGAYAHDYRTLTQTGRLAEVNFFQYGGEPFLAQGQTAVLYPPVYLAAALASLGGDLRDTLAWLALLHLAMGVVGFYFWMRGREVGPLAAALGGLAWALNPFALLLGASWITVTYVVAWLPWLFWALERTMARPTSARGAAVGVIFGLFVLQGYVQWATYALMFAGLHTLMLFGAAPGAVRWRAAGALGLGGLICIALTEPLLTPMLHALGESAARGQLLGLEQILFYRVDAPDLLAAQFGWFRPHFVFGASTALLFAPALVLMPLALAWGWSGDAGLLRRVLPLLVLAVIALLLAGRLHGLLSVVPLFGKFRWPFKVFIFADFFLLAALVQTLASTRLRRGILAPVTLAVVAALQLAVVATHHASDVLSPDALPVVALPAGVDPTVGRVIALGEALPPGDPSRFYTHAYGTFFAVPSLGGYNLLVSRQRIDYALGIDIPNFVTRPVTPDFRAQLESCAVRYWIVPADSPRRAEIAALPDVRQLAAEPDRVVFEDTRAVPLAFDTAALDVPLPARVVGNSLYIALHGDRAVGISLDPTDDWWYRFDGGPWQIPTRSNHAFYVSVRPEARELEVSYFDPGFREGLYKSGFISIFLLVFTLLTAIRRQRL
jgi:hypothetical protein